MRAFDVHVHLPTREWLKDCIGIYEESAQNYFNSVPQMRSVDAMLTEYADADLGGLLLGWDAERATGMSRLDDALIARVCELSEGRFTGFGSVDPLRPDAADALKRVADLGLRGVKLHPGVQGFDPSSDAVQPFFDRVAELGLNVLTHAGMSGLGARMPGGQGIRLDVANPMCFDRMAARLPTVKVMFAHIGTPWVEESLTLALHKTNVYVDMSGWRVKYLPDSFLKALKSRLKDQLCFGTDYPFFDIKQLVDDCQDLGLPEDVEQRFLIDNAKAFIDGPAA